MKHRSRIIHERNMEHRRGQGELVHVLTQEKREDLLRNQQQLEGQLHAIEQEILSTGMGQYLREHGRPETVEEAKKFRAEPDSRRTFATWYVRTHYPAMFDEWMAAGGPERAEANFRVFSGRAGIIDGHMSARAREAIA